MERVAPALREKCFFSARGNDAEVLGKMRELLGAAIDSSKRDSSKALVSQDKFISEMKDFLRSRGYTMGGSKLTDITSRRRLGLIYDMNVQEAREYARYTREQDSDALYMFPAQEFLRVEPRRVPRTDWQTRWRAAGGKLYLAGGFSYDPSTRTCTIPADMVPYDVAARQWGEPVPFPAKSDGGRYAISGGSGVAVGDYLLLTGGVDYKIFKEAMEGRAPSDYLRKPVEWYRFNGEVLVYNRARGDWSVSPGGAGLSRAGGVLLHDDACLMMVCGEVKPGIRSSKIGIFEWRDTDGHPVVVPVRNR